ncbi:MAG: UvrD-helicase domain-containing protein [Chlamydiae bacterium]|nr:UvrD-helicase domain-containing protein [Chlamydiota bacterium]
MKRFQVLDRKTQVFGRFFLEASAGTGKTFAIEHIAVRSLLESPDPLTIDQILIVTFTRAATRELKVRLRSNLTKTLLFLQSGSAGPDYLQPIFARGSSAVFSAIRKIEEALCNFDAAAIFTLHGFCHKMLTEYAFEAGTFFEISSPDSGNHSHLLFQVVEDFFRAGLKKDKYSPSQLEGILKSSSKGVEGLCKKIVNWVGKALFIPKSSTFSETLLEFQKRLKLVREKYAVNPEMLESDLAQILSCYKGVQSKATRQGLQLGSFLQRGELEYDELDQIIGSKDYILALLAEDNLKKGKNPKTLSLHYPTLFFELRDHLTPLIEEAAHSDKNFLRLVDDCMQKWKESIYYEESFSPDDLLRKMADALKKPALKERISEKYHVAIIDEFQDTDPLQWEIFKGLFIGETLTKTIYLVGDPKQSIYAFRNADVYTYLEAMQTLGEENRLFLDTNFRSEPSLVKALNALFTSHISKEWMQLPSLGKSLEVRAVSAKSPFPEIEEKTERASVHFFVAEGASGRSRKWPTEEVEEDSLFPFIVSEIHRMAKKEGYRFGQFSILVRDRFQASRLESFLKAWQVPCSVKRSFPIEESIAYIGLHDLIRAVISPDDVGALKRVLGGVFIGMNAHSLMGGMELESLQRARLYFQMARFLIAKKGWGAFFTNFLSEKWEGSEKTVLEEVLSRKDTSLYFEMRQLIQIFQAAPAALIYSLEGFYTFYKDLAHLGLDDELLKVASESEEDEVIVMTIHASKGLEFDIVFALGLVSRSTSQEDLLRTKVGGQETLETWDPLSQACIQSVLETDAEKMRHLYVALTRAKNRVYIPVAIDVDRKGISLSQASSIDLLCQNFGKESFNLLKAYQVIHEFTVENLLKHISLLGESASVGYSLISKEEIHLTDSLKGAPEKKLSFPEPFSPIFPPKNTLSFTALHLQAKVELSLIERPSTALEGMKEGILPLGAVTGTFLHRILELTLKEELHHPFQEEAIKQLINCHAMGHPLQGWEEELYALVKETLFAPLQGPRGSFCFADVPAKQLFLEMEFAFEHQGHMMKGFVDGVFMWENTYYIVDWKTNYLGPKETYTFETMGRAMEEQGYFLQAAIYAEALKRYLSQVEKRGFSSCFGGAIYIFMRGRGSYCFMPDLSLLTKMQAEEKALCDK